MNRNPPWGFEGSLVWVGILGRGWKNERRTCSKPDVSFSDGRRETEAMEGLRLMSGMSENKDSGNFRQGQNVGGNEI